MYNKICSGMAWGLALAYTCIYIFTAEPTWMCASGIFMLVAIQFEKQE